MIGAMAKTAPILVNMLNELQNQLASKCGRSAVCLYIYIHTYIWGILPQTATKNQFERYYVYEACSSKRELTFKCRNITLQVFVVCPIEWEQGLGKWKMEKQTLVLA